MIIRYCIGTGPKYVYLWEAIPFISVAVRTLVQDSWELRRGKKGVHFTLLTTFQAELVTIKTSTMNLQFMYCLQPGLL